MTAPSLRVFFTRHRALLTYLAKCVVGTVAIVLLSRHFGYKEEFWFLISFLLVLTPDSAEAMPLAIARMKANLCGAAGALLALASGLPQLPVIALAIVFTGILCTLWRVMTSCRVAMAATIIVLSHEPGAHLWDSALQRILAVALGCALGLAVTYLFHRKLPGAPALG